MGSRSMASDLAPGRHYGLLWRMVLGLTIAVLAAGGMVLAGRVHSGQWQLADVRGQSLRPFAESGDLVVTERVPASTLRVGDVVRFAPPGEDQAVVRRIATATVDGDTMWVTTRDASSGAADRWGQVQLSGPSVFRLDSAVPEVGFLAGVLTWLSGGGAIGVLMGVAGLTVGVMASTWLWRTRPRNRRTNAGLVFGRT